MPYERLIPEIDDKAKDLLEVNFFSFLFEFELLPAPDWSEFHNNYKAMTMENIDLTHRG